MLLIRDWVTASGWGAILLDGVEIKFQGWAGLDAKCTADTAKCIAEGIPLEQSLYVRLAAVYRQVMAPPEGPTLCSGRSKNVGTSRP